MHYLVHAPTLHRRLKRLPRPLGDVAGDLLPVHSTPKVQDLIGQRLGDIVAGLMLTQLDVDPSLGTLQFLLADVRSVLLHDALVDVDSLLHALRGVHQEVIAEESRITVGSIDRLLIENILASQELLLEGVEVRVYRIARMMYWSRCWPPGSSLDDRPAVVRTVGSHSSPDDPRVDPRSRCLR